MEKRETESPKGKSPTEPLCHVSWRKFNNVLDYSSFDAGTFALWPGSAYYIWFFFAGSFRKKMFSFLCFAFRTAIGNNSQKNRNIYIFSIIFLTSSKKVLYENVLNRNSVINLLMYY